MVKYKTLRLILGDQLNQNHSWFQQVDDSVLYVLMEIKPESEYVTHHIQKIVGIFAAMRAFAEQQKAKGHHLFYYNITDANNLHDFGKNLNKLISEYDINKFEYQEPDEYRLDYLFKNYTAKIAIESSLFSTEHFYTERLELKQQNEGKNNLIMENFYRKMRKKHNVLLENGKPIGGKWNYDHANRKKLPRKLLPPAPFLRSHSITKIYQDIIDANINYLGELNPSSFVWTIRRKEAIALLDDFMQQMLPNFGTYQDAMHEDYWSLYHSRLSFALNIKLISPKEVVDAVQNAYHQNELISIEQAEGFIRQILGWREFMRGVYWMEMPSYSEKNYLEAQRTLPAYFWDAKTKMNCVQKAIQQSLDYAYAHHIQRLMVTGNFCLLTGINPKEVDQWYLGIYIDAFEWVEITNTRGMSQFADGGIVATKPYCSSANYIDKMSNYCAGCYYNKKEKVGEKACPFNSLYWNFLQQHKDKFISNPRMSMMYRIWDKFDLETKKNILKQAAIYLAKIEAL